MRPARGDRPAHRVKLIELTPDPEPMARLTTTDPTSVCMVVPVAFDRRYVTWTGDVEVATHERGHALESPPVVVKIDGLGTGFPGRSFIDFHVSVCAREPAVVTGFELEIRLGRYSVHYPWSPLTDDPNRGDWFVDCGELTNRDKYLAARCAIQPEFAAPIGRAGTLVGWVRFDLPDLPKRDFPGGDATGTFKAILQQGPSAAASFPIALPRRPTAEHMAEVAARLRDEGAKDDSTP